MEQLVDLVVRRLERLIPALLQDEPVVVLAGPRTVGKSTLLNAFAGAAGVQVFDLDDVSTRGLLRDDLAFYVSGEPPVCIDEFQHIPDLLDAIKAELNRDGRPGRFLLTGSTHYSARPLTAQSLTGRVHVQTVWPLSQGEIAGTEETFVERVLDDADTALPRTRSTPDRLEYAARILAGGLPAPLRRPAGRSRTRWYGNYVDLVIERDVAELREVRQAGLLAQFLRRLVAQTGQILNMAGAARDSGLTPSVGEDYTRLLEAVFLVHRLPAWGTTLSSRVNRLPKIHVVDSGLGGWLLGLSVAQIEARRPAAMSEFGHLVETFVVNEVLKQAAWLDRELSFGHYRTFDDEEVDLVIEDAEGAITAIEIKAGSTYRPDDLRGLRHLQRKVGNRFRAGYLLHTGIGSARPADGLYVAPIAALWS